VQIFGAAARRFPRRSGAEHRRPFRRRLLERPRHDAEVLEIPEAAAMGDDGLRERRVEHLEGPAARL
jgi:hypothetical protein